MENKFYIYCYLDTRKPGIYNYGEYNFNYEPIYIGKGKNSRILKHLLRKDKSYFVNKINKIIESNLKPIYYKMFENLEESTSYELERKIIKAIGRIDQNSGPLCNLNSGGKEGELEISEESRQKMREAKIGKNLSENHKKKISEGNKNPSEETRQKMRNKIISEETRQKLSVANKNKIISEETKQKMSIANKI